jgi:SAM-dependent methyltransferase
VDPEGHEIGALSDLVELGNREVLEIGCGDGRLTWRYADATAHVTAIDPFPDAIERARQRLVEEPDERIDLCRASFEDFASSSGSSRFDVSILSWSLCCMRPEGMVHALEEIHRLLRPSGTLIEIHPVPEPSTIEVRARGEVLLGERDPDDDDEDELHAEEAVVEVVRRGRFVVDATRDFEFFTYASSVDELRNFFAVSGAYDDTPKDETLAARQEAVYGRAEHLIAASGGKAKIVYGERGRMNRMMPL